MLSELESDANRPEVHDFKSELVQGHTSATGMLKVTPLTAFPHFRVQDCQMARSWVLFFPALLIKVWTLPKRVS